MNIYAWYFATNIEYKKDYFEKMQEYFRSIGMPSRLADFGLDESCIDKLSELCTYGRQRTVKSYIDMDYDVIKEIFHICL